MSEQRRRTTHRPVGSQFFCAKAQSPRPYFWDFDRNVWDSIAGARSFSVGVYQWLPNASGKGLKKSKTVRVQGYVEDPQSVYVRAQELCDQLNASGAMATAPPDWLQKQYSVPRPGHVEPKDRRDGLTGAQVRSLRQQVMKRVLIPEGFVTGKDSAYVRQDGSQVHVVAFQPHYNHKFSVGLGFHYAFLPAFFHDRRKPIAEYRFLDCGLSARLEAFRGEGRFMPIPYGSDREELRRILAESAGDALRVFDRYRDPWRDCDWWLDEFIHGEPNTSDRIEPWRSTHLPLFLAVMAMHLGQTGIAMAELEKMSEGKSQHVRELYRNHILAGAG